MNTEKLTQLKSEAYDLLANIDMHNYQIQELQKKLAEKNAEIKTEYEEQQKQNQSIDK